MSTVSGMDSVMAMQQVQSKAGCERRGEGTGRSTYYWCATKFAFASGSSRWIAATRSAFEGWSERKAGGSFAVRHHPLPEVDRPRRVVARLRHQDQANVVGFALLRA